MSTHRARIGLALPMALLAAVAGAAGNGMNRITVKVANGPFAGSYHTDPESTICFRAKKQDVFSSAWKDFAADGRQLAEAGFQIRHPDSPGSKSGLVRISFGKDGKSAIYELENQPLNVTPLANGARVSAEGRTTDGIRFSLEAVCEDVEAV